MLTEITSCWQHAETCYGRGQNGRVVGKKLNVEGGGGGGGGGRSWGVPVCCKQLGGAQLLL